MDINAAKGTSLALLLVLTVVLGLLPVWLHQRRLLTSTGSRCRVLTLSLLNCFAGGVFLSTCLLHLMAEGREDLDRYLQHVPPPRDFPYYETLVAVGLFLVALVEKVGFALMSFSASNDQAVLVNSTSKPVTNSTSLLHRDTKTAETPNLGYGSTSDTRNACSKTCGMTYDSHQSKEVNDLHPSHAVMDGTHVCTVTRHGLSASAEHQLQLYHDATLRQSPSLPSSVEGVFVDGQLHAHHHHHHSVATSAPCDTAGITQVSGVRALLLLVALSFHTVFDGLAVGLQETTSEVWQVLGAIAIHKALVAFCLGLELAVASPGNARRPALFICLFALMSPIGLGVGMAVTSAHVDQWAELLTSSILQALATGTFLYVTFFEILGQQFAHSHHHHAHGLEILKVLVTFVGFGVMAATKLFDTD